MRLFRQGLSGLLVGLISFGLVIGGLSLSLMEGPKKTVNPLANTPTALILMPATYTNTPALSPAPGLSQTPSRTFTQTSHPTASLTPAPPTTCPAPSNWEPYTVQFGDSLGQLAQTYQTTIEAINRGNCLLTANLLPDTILYLPHLAATETMTSTITLTQVTLDHNCHPPKGWVTYVIQRGDTLIRLSKVYNVTLADLQAANCMGSSTILVYGQNLYVPFANTVSPPTPTQIYAAPTRTRTSMPPVNVTLAVSPSETSTFLATLVITNTPEPAPIISSTLNPDTVTPSAMAESTQISISTITMTASPKP